MRVVIATVQVPFVRGGAELLAKSLRDALHEAGHEVEIAAIPFKWYPPEVVLDHMLACRLLDLTESGGCTVDRIIALKFPAYLVRHPNKILWIAHQHKDAYELWDDPAGDLARHPNGVQVRRAIREADRQLIPQAKRVFAISRTVAARLKKFCCFDAAVLYPPPPNAAQFYSAEQQGYFLCPGRLGAIKRQMLILEALARTRRPVAVRFSGAAEDSRYAEELQLAARRLKLEKRVKWLGFLTESELRGQYAHAIAVLYPPFNEDYGYVTLEAMLSSKPVITCRDSGGPLEFVTDNQTGIVCEPIPESVASAMDRLWDDTSCAHTLGKAGRDKYESLGIEWPKVIKALLA
jgi:glycosyltransferase involved in cell wall biosynthesis